MAYFDLHIADFRTEGGSADLFERVVAAAEAAERAGFDAVSVMDHLHQIAPYMVRSDPIPEAYVLLGALAARTRRIRLGTLVTAVTYRNPALLAKMVTTLDVVSGGRAYLGIGASWNEDEYGPTASERRSSRSASASTASRRLSMSARRCSRAPRGTSKAGTTVSMER
jgi:alkanesulfonate monooxygenase SsuD/methylene tetrahydromethanopterin reductase-like flavin-dependent oxidoreductase (luciferase family)